MGTCSGGPARHVLAATLYTCTELIDHPALPAVPFSKPPPTQISPLTHLCTARRMWTCEPDV
jgi:hypothetical protein